MVTRFREPIFTAAKIHPTPHPADIKVVFRGIPAAKNVFPRRQPIQKAAPSRSFCNVQISIRKESY